MSVKDHELPPVELERIVRLKEASRLSGVSEGCLKENFGHLIFDITPRCKGMRLKHALQLDKEQHKAK